MAKGKYKEWLEPDNLLRLKGWARDGLTNKDIAKNIGISEHTLYDWISEYPQFSQSIKEGRAPVIIKAEDTIIKMGLGYDETIKDKDDNVIDVIHHSPDLNALRSVLRAYKFDTWGFKKDEIDRHKAQLEIEILQEQLDEIQQKKLLSETQEFIDIPANMIAPSFSRMHHDIENRKYREYILPGGRGSGKSTMVALEIIKILETNRNYHALICRNVFNTIKDSVYTQIEWAINELGLSHDYKLTKSPLEITKLSTGQKIYFRGADDPTKIKSIKPPFGTFGVVWFEELDQYSGVEAVRNIEQSVERGTDFVYNFKSFNPPRSKINWANKEVTVKKDGRCVVESCYLDMPEKWLGKVFLDNAEFLKEINPAAYENEYLGIANGSGGNVFENLEIREITDSEANSFDRYINGIDWGWYPDPFHFVRLAWVPSKLELVCLDEFRGNKLPNDVTSSEVKNRVTENELIICDNSELKSIDEFRDYGLNAVPAKKGPGSRDAGYKWLSSLVKIVVDPKRTPYLYEELINYEYERDKEGNLISGYPDGNDHGLDAMRYACEPLHKTQKPRITFF